MALLVAVFIALPQTAAGQTAGGEKDQPAGEGAYLDLRDPRFADVKQAAVLFQQGDVNGARRLLEKAKQTHDELPPGDVMLANLFLSAGQAQNARAALEKAVVSAENDPEAYLVLGDLAFAERQVTASDLLFGKAHQLIDNFSGNPQRKRHLQIRALAGLAATAESRGQWTLAEKRLRNWLEIDKQSINASTRLGQVLFQRKQPREAYQVFLKLYQADPSTPRPEISMALLFHERRRQGDAAQAKRLMEMAAQRDSKNVMTRLAVAQWALESCLIDLAKTHSEAALNLDDRSLEAMMIRGLAALHQKDFPAAEADFQAVLSQSKEHFSARHHLVLALVGQADESKRKTALEHARLNVRLHGSETAMRSNPQGREAAIALAWVRHRFGDREQVQTQITQALSSGPVSPDSVYLASRMLHELQKNELARRILDGALQSSTCFAWKEDARELLERLKK